MSFKKQTTRSVLALSAIAAAVSFSANANDSEERVIVGFTPGAQGNVEQVVQAAGGRKEVDLRRHNAMAITVPSQALNGLANNPNVTYIEEDAKRELYSTEFEPNAPYGIGMVQADLVSDAAAGNRTVCVIDSGYDLGHPDLQTSGVTGEFDSGTGDWFTDENGHGTHVTGTIAALANGLGVVGVMPNGKINLHVVKVFSDSGWSYSSSLVAAADQCADYGSNVINMSLGGGRATNTERNAFQSLQDAGVLSIAAAGNDGTTQYSYPASYDAVVSVAAIDSDKALASFSQRNDQVEISAPGVDVLSTVPRGMGQISMFTAGNSSFSANAMDGSPEGNPAGELMDCGLGTSTCADAVGKVCLMERGEISFADKALACEDGGGVAAVVYNNESGALSGTLGNTNVNIPVVGISDTDGAAALNDVGQMAEVSVGASDWAYFNGTSMASPHVAGVAALVWSHFTECSAVQIRDVLNNSAQDLGTSGRNNEFGYGLVQAQAAVNYLNNNPCDGSGDDGTGGDDGNVDSPITATADAYKVRGRVSVDVSWTGAESNQVTVARNGSVVATVNTSAGSYTDETGINGSGTFTYQVCEAGTDICSDEIDVTY